MLFCSQQFLVFFTLIFISYWALRSQWARGGLLLAAGSCCCYGAWQQALAWNGSPGALGGFCNFLQAVKGEYWLAGLVCLAMIVGFLAGHDRGRVWLLLGASFFFYASWNRWLALLICVSTALDYVLARGLEATSSSRGRKFLVTVSVVANLALLCYFKYANFFLHSLEEALHACGASASLPVLSVLLPIGISFYTFEAINYTVDVYRRRAPAERNLVHFMLFITFFPHLVAGPIVRARDFLPQIRRAKRWNWSRVQLGGQFLLLGLFKKLAIADRMALFADPVFQDPSQYCTSAVWLATLAYALQIYCDFSGYSDMALGCAHLLGYKLAQNFNLPYLSRNVSEFWHRWHISLSSWLRDYLFIPLGGSRGSNRQTCRNLLVTMALGGLWHGASWTFVVWGVLHGFLLIVHRFFKAFCKPRPALDRFCQSGLGTALCVGTTFLTVCLGWVFFRANTFGAAAEMVHRMVRTHAGLRLPLHPGGLWYTAAAVALCHTLARKGFWADLTARVPAPLLGFGYAAVATLALVLAPDSGKAFIYFQF